MRFVGVFVLLALLGSPVWAQEKQPLTVLSENPINISQAFTEQLKIGLRNEGEQPLTLSFKFSAAPDATGTTQTLEARNERYLPVDVPEQVMKADAPGILIISAQPTDSEAAPTIVERELETITIAFYRSMPLLPGLALVLVFVAWFSGRPRGAPFFRSWIPGKPQLDLTKSLGSLSALLFAVSNTGILSALAGVPDSDTQGLQIMAVLCTAPIVLAPLIVKLSATLVEPASEKEKSPVWANLLNVFLVLVGLFAQTYLMYLWLTDAGGVFVFLNLNVIFPVIIGCIVAISGLVILTKTFSKTKSSAVTSGSPTLVPGPVAELAEVNTLFWKENKCFLLA